MASQHPSVFFLFLYRSVYLTTMRVSFWASKFVLVMSCLTVCSGFPLYLKKDPNSLAMAHKVPHNSASAHLTNLTCNHCPHSFTFFQQHWVSLSASTPKTLSCLKVFLSVASFLWGVYTQTPFTYYQFFSFQVRFFFLERPKPTTPSKVFLSHHYSPPQLDSVSHSPF